MSRFARRFWEMVRYGIKGSIATILNVALMAAFVEIFTISPEVAALVSTSVLVSFGYLAMHLFVFPDAGSNGNHLRRGGAYYAIILTGKAANYAIFVGLIAAGIWYPVAWIVGAGTVFLGTYTANRRLWHSEVIA